MMDLITKLEKEMNQKNLSAEDTAKIIGCSFSQVYRWIKRENKPNFLYRKAVERAIKKMKRMTTVVTIEMAEKDRALYKKLKKKISIQEKRALFQLVDDYSAYQKELSRLAKKYNTEE